MSAAKGAVTVCTKLPTDDELTVEEVPISSPGLRAASHYLGKFCDEESKEFMLCRQELLDPRLCLNEGKAVTACAMNFFRKMKAVCMEEFERHSKCLDYSSTTMAFKRCRETQEKYDRCMFDFMNMDRPPLGYFARPRVHTTKRPPVPLRTPKVYPDATPGLPEDYPIEEPLYGSRFYGLH